MVAGIAPEERCVDAALTRLYCMNCGHHLQILPDGTDTGQRDCIVDIAAVSAAVLRVKAVGRAVVAIKGTEAGRYLAMNKDGPLLGSVSNKTLKTVHIP
ncbi:putative fibroblast growth factor 1 [Osmerus eperlanus]|uniref:putative fibroblast growth factor 1 n=1 Tax=Osmerus eperlanus TaxID=29151 RepID=UPI002E129C94